MYCRWTTMPTRRTGRTVSVVKTCKSFNQASLNRTGTQNDRVIAEACRRAPAVQCDSIRIASTASLSVA